MFSVIIPLYNKSKYISRAIESVLAQTYQEFEIIVINDGSTDGSEKIVETGFGNQVTLINQANQGVSAARNNGISIAHFPYIAFLDGDDFWHADYLQRVYEVISQNHRAAIIATAYEKIGKSKSKVNPDFPQAQFYAASKYFKQAVTNTIILTSAMVMRKEFFERFQGFDASLKFGEDLDVWYRAMLYYGRIYFIPENLVYYSKEDETAATKQMHHISDTIIVKILASDYFDWRKAYDQTTVHAFDKFKARYVYSRLYPYYQEKQNQKPIKEVLLQLPIKNYFISVIYLMPFGILHQLFKNKIFMKMYYKHLKFFLKNVYK